MNKSIIALLAVLLLAFTAFAESPEGGSKSRLAKTAEIKYDFININSILMWFSNNGDMSQNPTTAAAGLEWPQGSGKTAIFEDGIIWGGRVAGTVRVGGSAYRHGLQPGPLDGQGNVVRLATDPKNRIYKAQKVTPETFKSLSATDQARLIKDYNEWPVDDGAPYHDKDGVPGYQPNWDKWLAEQSETDPAKHVTDEPFLIGDQVFWYVSNDMDGALTSYLYGSPPIGIECQTLVWGYASTGPLGNMVFTKYRIVNRGPNDVIDAYLSKWSDPDLGYANDDFCGVDTTLSLGYVYNGLAKDADYGIPPAAGYDFFQGPIVQSAGDTATFNFGKLPGWKNLKISSFAFYINGSGVYADPTQGDPSGTTQMYNYQKGLLWNGQPFIDPLTGQPTKFTLAGDPITKTGWCDGNPAGPGDRRFLMTAGPFTLNRNEPQELVVATIIGRGSDRISSIQVLKYYDQFAQIAFDNNFNLPKAPPQPNLEYAVENNRIILYWGNPKTSAATEYFADKGYKFEGYNVYQLSSPSQPLSQAKRLATYDLIDNIATIFDNVIDERSGAVVNIPVQFGGDTDVQRQYTVTTDEITGTPIVNNQPYYFCVTAYSYNPAENAVPHVLESTPKVIEVRPQFPNPGFRNNFMQMDSAIVVKHLSGTASGPAVVQVVDALKLTGDTYQVTLTKLIEKAHIPFDDDNDPTTPPIIIDLDTYGWNLKDVTTGQSLADTVKWFNGLTNSLTADGFKVGMAGVPNWIPGKEVSSVNWVGTNSPDGVFTAASSDYDWTLGAKFFGTALNPWEVVKTVEIRFSRTQKSKGYMYLRGGTPNYGYQGYFDSPITVWDVSDPANPKQLEYAWVEQSGSAYNNQEWGPGTSTGDREYMFVLDEPYSDTPNPFYTTLKPNADAGQMKILYNFWGTQSTTYPQSSPTDYKWADGDKWVITANIPLTTADVYEFSTKKWEYSDNVAKTDVNSVNVFPNPYFGDNLQELNKYQRFVNFNHLPPNATIRVYTLAGTLVKTIQKFGASGVENTPYANTQMASWDLRNENGLPVGSGMYIIHIDMPGLGTQKVLKLAVIMEAQFLDRI